MDLAVLSEMTEKMRVRNGDDDRTILSKKLSYVLRHGAKQLELEINDGGYVSINDLLACEALFGGVALEALLEVVEQSNQEKQRYEVLQKSDDWLIRATGKHTMQGLSPVAAREKKGRRAGREARGAGSGDRIKHPPLVSEDEFCARWRLDRLARLRLNELPLTSRQQVMERFSPSAQVPEADFPKVFVAFCKRFRGKGKEDGFGAALEADDRDGPEVVVGEALGWLGPPARSRAKKKAIKERGCEEEAPDSADLSPLRQASEPLEYGEPFPAYPSPGSTPRSLSGGASPQALPLHIVPPPVPVSSPGRPSRPICAVPPAPQGSPRLLGGQLHPPVGPPPPAYPPQGMPGMAMAVSPPLLTVAPPPPSHPPQVAVLGTEGPMTSMCCGGYQEHGLLAQHIPGGWSVARPTGHCIYPEAGDRARAVYHEVVDYGRSRGPLGPPGHLGHPAEYGPGFARAAVPPSPSVAREAYRSVIGSNGWVQTGDRKSVV